MGSKDVPQKMQFLGAVKTVASPSAFYTKCKCGGKLPQIWPEAKQVRIPMFLHIPRTGANMHIWLYELNMPWENVLAFLKPHPCSQKTCGTVPQENNRFSVPSSVQFNSHLSTEIFFLFSFYF